MISWIVLQLADSAFPTGGFTHSAGLEALVQAGEVGSIADLERHCGELLVALSRGALPIVGAAHDEPAHLTEHDAFTETIMWSHVAARASRAQGRALLDVAARSFGLPALVAARAQLPDLHGHLAPVFGFVTSILEVSREDALAAFLHLSLRGTISAAVRLGGIGPTEAQRLQHRLHPQLASALAQAERLGLSDVAQTSPLTELFGAAHDRLYSRLFQS